MSDDNEAEDESMMLPSGRTPVSVEKRVAELEAKVANLVSRLEKLETSARKGPTIKPLRPGDAW